ncbi:MAG: hypothetical protein M9950_09405 [Thermomicrobiales bacterium]|nr:hypothetical protein [Thermomicrobiales bacterium]
MPNWSRQRSLKLIGGDDWTHYAPVDGLVVRLGDERQGGQIVYFRAK